ncbi:hypothetical protein HY498_01655 [Candidatus Woesearchaeota archaeon]|nr:hypothetical protein [Candidatus Woesearchaeota archaeon]
MVFSDLYRFEVGHANAGQFNHKKFWRNVGIFGAIGVGLEVLTLIYDKPNLANIPETPERWVEYLLMTADGFGKAMGFALLAHYGAQKAAGLTQKIANSVCSD